jgi:hypothetical protein
MAPFSLRGRRLIFVKSNVAEDPELLFKSIDDIAFRDPLSAESRKIRTVLLLAGAVSDKWPVHVYIDGARVVGRWLADRMDEAFEHGFSVAAQEIDGR